MFAYPTVVVSIDWFKESMHFCRGLKGRESQRGRGRGGTGGEAAFFFG